MDNSDLGKIAPKSRRNLPAKVPEVNNCGVSQLNPLYARSCGQESTIENGERSYHVHVKIEHLNTLAQNLAAKLALNSKQSAAAREPYWEDLCVEISKVLLSHWKTDSYNGTLISESNAVPKTLASSWFSTKLNYLTVTPHLKISCSENKSFQINSTDSENSSLKSLKIRIYPEPSKRYNFICKLIRLSL